MWWDERAPGGRLKAILFLLHPGPSILVTATFVAIAGLARGAVPSASLGLRLVLVMLPIQFAIGVSNDVADLRADAAMKPYKPLVRGSVERRRAVALAVGLAVTGLAVAATINLPTLALAAGGLGAGLIYDLGLRQTRLSWVPWWAGISILPLAAYASVGALSLRLLVLLPLSLLVALALHCANALPDIASDRAAGRTSLPVLLGEQGSRAVAVAGLAAAGVLALTLLRPLGQSGPWVPASAVVLAVVVLMVALARLERPFPLMALGTAVFAVTWLATLPVG